MLLPTGFVPRGGRQYFLLGGLATILLILAFLQTRPPTSVARKIIKPGQERLQKPNQILEIEGLKLGEHFAPPNTTGDPDYTEWLQEALQSRFANVTNGNADYPFCNPKLDRYKHTALEPSRTYLPELRGKREAVVAIAINLHNSESIIPAQAIALIGAIGHMIKHNKVYVSIFENGSSDQTPELLSQFASALQAIGVDGLFVHTSHMASQYYDYDRIVVLSEIRNLALAPLMPYATNTAGTGTLLFLNDVVACASDVLELIHQQRLQQADMAVGIDWGSVKSDEEDGPPPTTRLYDMWVLRGINGELPYEFEKEAGYSPHTPNNDWVKDAFSTQTPLEHGRWLDGRPFPIYSGWGGMAAFDSSLFTHQHLRFRSSTVSGWDGGSTNGALSEWGRLIAQQGYMQSDCPGASECEYIARDIWNMRDGKARIVMAPQTRTTYNVEDWNLMQQLTPAKRRDGPREEQFDLVDWDNVTAPEQVVCIATRTDLGVEIDTWDERNDRKRLSPMFSYDDTP